MVGAKYAVVGALALSIAAFIHVVFDSYKLHASGGTSHHPFWQVALPITFIGALVGGSIGAIIGASVGLVRRGQ